MDHFARLGVPAALDLEPAVLDKAYFALQRRWHPDRFVGKPAEERARASTEAAALNDAYRTLKDPLARAVYLAGLKGVELPGDGKTIDDPELLMEAMESREALHDATTIEAIDSLADQARQQSQQALTALGSLFLRDDKPAIRKALLRLRYLDKFAEEAQGRRANLVKKVGIANG
ncbi:molecular chaperone HscB [Enhydrobacter aerosaccus]|uniref:Co-chaperone protein HscB homolog n=1 Tax=Enhydrobacter aerosaccus TaxID=225324 RepID=A0A1T4LJW3_9HYPH|nr:Fe-S protein assembly co-chaperone HscB [Enhydrobacter aerosaccus]SJZ54921.1 molecular chaperone HscB [Enhydrobacter aerosaccus]